MPVAVPALHPYLQVERPFVLAHRGLATHATENSLEAFAAAVAVGVTHVETDVHVTADGVLVIFHDQRLDRLTNLTGPVAGVPWSTLRRARLAGGDIAFVGYVLDQNTSDVTIITIGSRVIILPSGDLAGRLACQLERDFDPGVDRPLLFLLPPARSAQAIREELAARDARTSDAVLCERCRTEMFRMHAVWRCPGCGYKTDCCGW